MSGDVQPKKRRDKRKKKEDHQEEVLHQPPPAPTPIINVDDTNIHIHKDKSVGGGICAKCVFFIITLAIAIILGLTIVEHRGLTDIDIPLSESRFASIFEGWIDTEKSDHDDHTEETTFDHDESHEEEDEGIGSEEEEEEEEQGESEQEQDVDEDEQKESEQDQEESEQDQEESEQDQEESEQEPEEDEDDEEVEPESPEIQAESEEDEEQPEESEEEQPEESEEEQPESEEEQPESEEQVQESEEVQQPEESEEDQLEGEGSQEDQPEESDEKSSVKEPRESEEEQDLNEKDEAQENPEGGTNTPNTGVAAKIFVGAALLVVAYVVLIKKWKSERIDKPAKKEEEDETPNLSRRNTIVPPPTLEEVEQDIEDQEEYSEEEEEEEESEEEIHLPTTKRQYEELRAKYTRSLTPEDKEQEEYDEEQEEEEIEEEEEEYEDRDEEEDEEEEDDDEDLMKKLEEKYGKLNVKGKYEAEEEEEQEEEEEEEEDIDDDGSWKRVKRSDEPESESDDERLSKKRSGAQAYEYESITNDADFLIKDTLDYAQQHLPNNLPLALNLFIRILENYPESPRALYGRALTLEHMAEKKRSNEILQESIKYFTKVLNAKNVPDALFLAAATRCTERMRFIGNYAKAIDIHQKLIARFPNEIKHRNDFAVTLLTINRIPLARTLLLETLKKWPNDGFALVHYGFILKTVDNNLPLAIEYFTKGISTKEPGVVDGRFYFHLGDALARIGKPEEAIKIYEDGVNQKVFLSKYQRSLYNVDRLTGRPWWNLEETPYSNLYQLLQQNWREIRKEGLSMLDKKGYFKDESENLKDVGDWKQFELFARGVKNKENCLKCPVTCQIIDSSPEARTCRRGQVKFSVMHPGTHVWPHCGPTNCRLRVHLGLKVPPKTYIRVAEETRSWEEGKVMIFDDSFEHEVWHNGTEYRLVLIVDVWHPELTKSERINLSPI